MRNLKENQILTARTCRLNKKHMQVHTFDTSTMMPFSVRFIGNCENIGISFFSENSFCCRRCCWRCCCCCCFCSWCCCCCYSFLVQTSLVWFYIKRRWCLFRTVYSLMLCCFFLVTEGVCECVLPSVCIVQRDLHRQIRIFLEIGANCLTRFEFVQCLSTMILCVWMSVLQATQVHQICVGRLVEVALFRFVTARTQYFGACVR